MKMLIKLFQIFHYNGIKFCSFRVNYVLKKKLGLLKHKFPSQNWSKIELIDLLKPHLKTIEASYLQIHKNNGRRFFFNSNSLPKLKRDWKTKIIVDGNDILHNKFRYFFNKIYSLGSQPDWFLNPFTGKRANSKVHWTEARLFDSEIGDIKCIWEPSRFAWAYTLARAFAATENEKYVEKFWTLFDSWLHANPPNMGPNYACGQECALRLMAMCFVFHAFSDVRVSTPKRMARLALAIAVHASRIEKNVAFAISTRTNHALTEAAALYTTGLLFPEFSHSSRWFHLGKKNLTNEGLKQIYPDGSYIQHSMNYHRLMLHTYIWILRLAQINGDSYPQALMDLLKKALKFLYDMQDQKSGRAPNYGPNDGALILPLNCCDYLDYRPVIQSMYYLLTGRKLYENGPWDEDLCWLFGDEAINSPILKLERESTEYPEGGYYTLRGNKSWAMIRCHSYHDRPGQADMLHLDLWCDGVNVLRDSGSFMYYCEEPWRHYFLSTAAHNTVSVDGRDQMDKGSRFTWYNWIESSLPVMEISENGRSQFLSGSHFGFKRLGDQITHYRSIAMLSEGEIWIVVDDIGGTGMHSAKFYWHLANEPIKMSDAKIEMKIPAGLISFKFVSQSNYRLCCINGNEEFPEGFQSLYYAERTSAPTIIAQIKQELPIRFVSIIGLGHELQNCIMEENKLKIINIRGKQFTLKMDQPSFVKSVFA